MRVSELKIRIVVDATELYIEQPSYLALQSVTWSHYMYKSCNTLKGLMGIISPFGCVTFISELWAGSISGVEVTENRKYHSICCKLAI